MPIGLEWFIRIEYLQHTFRVRHWNWFELVLDLTSKIFLFFFQIKKNDYAKTKDFECFNSVDWLFQFSQPSTLIRKVALWQRAVNGQLHCGWQFCGSLYECTCWSASHHLCTYTSAHTSTVDCAVFVFVFLLLLRWISASSSSSFLFCSFNSLLVVCCIFVILFFHFVDLFV